VTLSHEDVQDIIALLDSLPYDEITLETSRFSLHLRRAGGGVWAQETQVLTSPVPAVPGGGAGGQAQGCAAGARQGAGPPPAPPAPPAGAAPPVGASPAGPAPVTGPVPPPAGLAEIRAPLPGTFYRAPQPGAPPFVDIGSQVAGDTVVAIIETMKLMNPVYAQVAGTVTEICLADGELAAQGAVLMRVGPQPGSPQAG
jgi:acetyl-CoA carboxylase biotin carboxyl carrier protein